MYPNIMDQYWHILSEAEQKVLDYLLRRTFGFQKTEDKISASQFVKGLSGHDNGTGLEETAVRNALKTLEQKGFIKIHRSVKENGENDSNKYQLVMAREQMSDAKKTPRGLRKAPRGGAGETGTINSYLIDRDSIDRRIKEIHLSYQEKICSGARLTKNGRKMIAARLKEYSPDEIKNAITGFSLNKWWMDNHAGEGVEWFFKSEGQIDRWLNLPSSPENRKEEIRRGSLG